MGCVMLELTLGDARFNQVWMHAYDRRSYSDSTKFMSTISSTLNKVLRILDEDDRHRSGSLMPMASSLLRIRPTERVSAKEVFDYIQVQFARLRGKPPSAPPLPPNTLTPPAPPTPTLPIAPLNLHTEGQRQEGVFRRGRGCRGRRQGG